VLKLCSAFFGAFAQVGSNLDSQEQSEQGVSHIAQLRGTTEVYGRFMGGSGRNTSNSGRLGQSVQFMHVVQRRINTGDCASC
jgi:hypothetical protein